MMPINEIMKNVLIDNLDVYSKLLTQYKLENDDLSAKLKLNQNDSNNVMIKANEVVNFLEINTGKTGGYQKAFRDHVESLVRGDKPPVNQKG